MSPVQQSPARNPRSMALALAGVVVGIALVIGLFVVAIPSLTESGDVQVNLGDDVFAPGPADRLARTIDEGGPLLFSDVSSGQRDIFLQHTGDSDTEGWAAFDARRPNQTRDCSLRWDQDEQHFEDPCDGTIVPADGTGLLAYPVTVNEDGGVIVDLTPDDAPAPGDTTP